MQDVRSNLFVSGPPAAECGMDISMMFDVLLGVCIPFVLHVQTKQTMSSSAFSYNVYLWACLALFAYYDQWSSPGVSYKYLVRISQHAK